MHNQSRAPKFLAIEIHFGLVFNLATQILASRRINYLREPPAHWLYAEIDLQIAGNRSSRCRIHHDKKRSETNVRMRPQRNDARSNVLIHDDRKWRAIMGTH